MRKRIGTAAALALVAGAALAPPSLALAQGGRQQTVQIRIPRGEVCFRHVGRGTTFVGDFRRGQQLVATSTGDFAFSDGQVEWTETRQRSISVLGPNRRPISVSEQGRFVAPADGRYSFTFYPRAAVGGPGVFIVCAF